MTNIFLLQNEQNAIDLAILQGYLELAELMQQYRSNPQVLDDWEKDRGQQPPPKKQPPPGEEKKKEEAEEQKEKNNLLLNSVIRGNQAKVKELLKDGASINFKNKVSKCFLHSYMSCELSISEKVFCINDVFDKRN